MSVFSLQHYYWIIVFVFVNTVNTRQIEYIGKVLSVQFNDLTKAEGNDFYALSHPRFVEWRIADKDETDSLEKAFKLRDMAKNLK